jgi:hypothetical protein
LARTIRYTIDEVKKIFEDAGCVLLSEEYVNSKTSMEYICSCGNLGNQSLENFKQSKHCKTCGLKKRSASRRMDIKSIRQLFKDSGCVLLSKEYVNRDVALDYICSCGNSSKISLDNFKRGNRCKECGIKKRSDSRRRDLETVRRIFEDAGCVLLSKDYVNCDTPLEYICSCGSISSIPLSYFEQGSRCRICSNKNIAEGKRLGIESVRQVFEDAGCVLLSKEYVNSKTPVEYICDCGNIRKICLTHFKQGKRCKDCGIKKYSGTNNPNWNHLLSDEDRALGRKIPGYSEWRASVYQRDNYECACCGERGGRLNAHHLDGYSWCVERRTDVTNGVTLCSTCHKDFHNLYGNRHNTESQYNQWLRNKRKQGA